MASSERSATPTVAASSAGQLIRRIREAAGLEPEALARRAGVDVAQLSRIETGEEPAGGRLLEMLLLVVGYRPVESASGCAAAPRPLGRYDAEQLAAAVAAPRGELLERALEWNAFAAELAAAGPPDATAATDTTDDKG